MNRVIIDKNATLKLQGKTLIVEDMKLPLRLVDMLILSHKADITLKELSSIVRNDVAVLIVTSNPKEFIHMQKRYFKNAHLKESQYQALNRRIEIAKAILTQKIQNSSLTLKKLGLSQLEDTFLLELQNAKRLDHLIGIEGSVAREYFRRYFRLFSPAVSKGKRTKNPPQDPINAMLSYTYTIFYFEIATWLNFYGFEPLIGYLHRSFRDHLALSSDILECLRAEIDLFVAKLFLDSHISAKDFTKKGGVYLTPTARKNLWHHLKPFIEAKEQTIKEHIACIKKMIENSSSSQQTQR